MDCPLCRAKSQSGATYCNVCGSPFTLAVKPVAASAVAGTPPVYTAPLTRVTYASFWERAAAAIIDGFLYLAASAATTWIIFRWFQGWFQEFLGAITIGDLTRNADPAAAGLARMAAAFVLGNLLLRIIANAAFWLYATLSEASSWQGTLGKRLLKIRVTDLEGNRIGFARANSRFFSRLLSGLCFGLGFGIAPFTERSQALHDMIAGTLVIKD